MAQENTRLMKANFHSSELGINGSEVYTYIYIGPMIRIGRES